MVMPEVGFEVTPTSPTIRELTVTKKKAKTPIQRAASALAGKDSRYPRRPGTTARTRRIMASNIPTVRKLRSSSVRSTFEAASPTRWEI